MKKTTFIQAKFKLRVLFGIVSLLILLTLIGIVVREQNNRNKWKKYQAEYNSRYIEKLNDKIKEAEQTGDQDELKK